ncbi:Protein of unknown function [Gryllus bimaculatus]|nr:Protein of unknown function [Gryllus bimaculatus]
MAGGVPLGPIRKLVTARLDFRILGNRMAAVEV